MGFGEEKKDEDLDLSFADIAEDNDEGKGKIVKFAEVEAEKKDAELDQERSRQQLLSKIARLTEVLNEAQQQVQEEKDKRKKKEKSLLKLAKELKKRNLVREKEEDRLEELEEKKKYLEHHWVLAQKELDQEKALHTKLQTETQKEHDEAIKEEKRKFEKTKQEHEVRLSDMKKAHMDQCEELGREVMKAKLEAERLHNELTARGHNVPRHTFTSEKGSKKGLGEKTIPIVLLSILVIVFAIVANLPRDTFTKAGLCAPVVSGTTLDDNAYGAFEAPWWAPKPFKEKAFNSFCADTDSVPSSIEWKREAKNNKLIVSVNGDVVLKRSIAKAQVASDKILLTKRNGSVDKVSLNWLSTK